MIMLRLLRRVFSAEGMGILLVLIALQALTTGISASLRNTETKHFFWVCLLAALIAFGLSKWNANGIHAAIGMIALGIIGVWILGARLTLPLLDLGRAVMDVIAQIIPAIRSKLPVDTTALAKAWVVVAESSQALSLRIQTWLISLNGDVTVNDALMRNMIWVLIVWLIAAWMGWFAARRNAIAALLPSMLMLAAIISYSEHRVEMLWLMVFVLLLLMGIWNYRNHTAQWESRKVDYSDSIRYDVSQAVVLLSLLIGVLAFVTPSISWQSIRDFLRDRNRNEIAETLGIQQQPVPARKAPVQQPTLPRDHLLIGSNAQSEEVVMTIRTGELRPMVNPAFPVDAPRYYWRSTTYDIYTGAGWVTSSAPGQAYPPDTPLIPGLLNGYRVLHLDVEMLQPEGKLFWSGILFSTNVPVTTHWRLRPPSDLFADQSALLQADMFAALSKADAYQAESYIPLVTVEALQSASENYPEDIRDPYLLLPRALPERVSALAIEITKDQTTAYDKAKAIEAFLRTYPYDLEIPDPPSDQDVVDYFLFDLKKGYCDYYATAMVVLARASGLPARFVTGYAPGSYDAVDAEYIIRELHAHSWAEIYFPEIGWIEFEPTAAQPEIELPPSEAEIASTPPDETAARLLNRFRIETFAYWLSPFAIVLLSVLIYFALIERWLYMRLAPSIAVERIYRRLYRLGRPLAGESSGAETAYEFMQKLLDAIDSIIARSRIENYLSPAKYQVQLLTDMYQKTLFAHRTIDQHDVRTALDTWKHLRLRLLMSRLLAFATRALIVSKQIPGSVQH